MAALEALPGAVLLIAKDPELGMTRFIGRSGWDFTLDRPFAQWFEREPDKALDWVVTRFETVTGWIRQA